MHIFSYYGKYFMTVLLSTSVDIVLGTNCSCPTWVWGIDLSLCSLWKGDRELNFAVQAMPDFDYVWTSSSCGYWLSYLLMNDGEPDYIN